MLPAIASNTCVNEVRASDRLYTASSVLTLPFASLNGPRFYGLLPNEARITLRRRRRACRSGFPRAGAPRCRRSSRARTSAGNSAEARIRKTSPGGRVPRLLPPLQRL